MLLKITSIFPQKSETTKKSWDYKKVKKRDIIREKLQLIVSY